MKEYTSEQPHISEYFNILIRHRVSIFLCTLMLALPLILFTFLSRPVYRGMAGLIIDKEQILSPLTGERTEFETDQFQSLTFKTHFQMISSRPVLEKVISDLDLQNRENDLDVMSLRFLLRKTWEKVRKWTGKKNEVLTAEEKQQQLVEKLREKIRVHSVRNTRLVKISAEDHDPVLARDLANAVAGAYIRFHREDRLGNSGSSISLMNSQLQETKEKLEEAEKKFLRYKEKENIFSLEGKQQSVAQKIEEFNGSYIRTRNERMEMETRLKKLEELRKKAGKNTDMAYVRSLLENPLIENLYSSLLEMGVEHSHLAKIYGENHPKMQGIKTKLQQTRQKIRSEIQKEIRNMEAAKSVLAIRENLLKQSIADFEEEAIAANRKELGYIIRERDVETHRKLYNTLLSKIKESDITDNIAVSNIRISEPAIIPPEPVRPRKMLNTLLSLLFGITAGICFALFREYMDRSLHTEADVQNSLEMPVFSVVPAIPAPKKNPYGLPHFLGAFPPDSPFTEAFRNLRTNVRFNLMKKSFQTLLVCSAGEGEGKTSAAAGLGYSLAEIGKRVLLVDADIRKPALSRLVTGESSPDSSDARKDRAHPLLSEVRKNLFLLPAAAILSDTSEITDPEKINSMIAGLKEQFDLVIIDTPPVLFTKDALLLAPHADGVLLVIRSGLMNRQIVGQVAEQIRRFEVKLIGVVLNRVHISREGYYKYHSRYYSKYYGKKRKGVFLQRKKAG